KTPGQLFTSLFYLPFRLHIVTPERILLANVKPAVGHDRIRPRLRRATRRGIRRSEAPLLAISFRRGLEQRHHVAALSVDVDSLIRHQPRTRSDGALLP